MPDFSQLFGGNNFKSVQRGVFSVTGVISSDISVPINAVNPAFSKLEFLGAMGYTGDGTSSALRPASHGYVRLAPDGQSVIVRSAGYSFNSNNYPMNISWELTEYYPS